MQEKYEIYDELPKKRLLEIAQYLPNRALLYWVQTSRYHVALFKPMADVRKLLHLLHHVTRGKHDVVEAMLKQDINLIYKRGVVTDYYGREFENISGFEYALWALDKHMWAKMITYIPSNEEGIRIFKILIAQYNKVNTIGVTYRLNGETITEKHFDFENTIIKELKTQVDSINAPGDKNWGAIDKQWREGVGGAQKQLPTHIVDEYCSSEPFYPVPKFTSQPKSSKQFYNWATNKNENWFSIDSKLSVDFAIYKGGGCARMLRWALWPRGGAAEMVRRGMLRRDLDAMTALCKVRTDDFIDLKSQLEDQMTLDNHHQVSQI